MKFFKCKNDSRIIKAVNDDKTEIIAIFGKVSDLLENNLIFPQYHMHLDKWVICCAGAYITMPEMETKEDCKQWLRERFPDK